MKEIHIGQAIEQRLHDLRMTQTEFGKLIGCPQPNIKRILSSPYIRTDKLQQICQVLNYNFFKELSDSVENAEK